TAASPRFSAWLGAPDGDIGGALDQLGVKLIDVSETFRVKSRQAPPTSADVAVPKADALILFPSGTTRQPKGGAHTLQSLRRRWTALEDSVGIQKFRRTLCLLPTHFGHGLICNCLFPWLFGQDLYVLPPFRPDLLVELGSVVDRYGITFLSSVPTVWR